MKLARKIMIAVTLFCYLAASSVASAHGFSSLTLNLTDSPASQATLMPVTPIDEAQVINCHPSVTQDDDKSGSTACKIFCSVMAHAVVDTIDSITFDVKPLTGVAFLHVSVLSRQLAVETHPPK